MFRFWNIARFYPDGNSAGTCARLCHASGRELEQMRIPSGARLGSDHRTLSGLYAVVLGKDLAARQRDLGSCECAPRFVF
jgi:hypothetical protein